MTRDTDPTQPATSDQIAALKATTNVNLDGLALTKRQASGLLAEVEAGREPTVRNVLIARGGVPLGELPDVDEVGVSSKLGHDVVYLPRTVHVPRDTKLIARQLPDGSIVIKPLDPRPRRKN